MCFPVAMGNAPATHTEPSAKLITAHKAHHHGPTTATVMRHTIIDSRSSVYFNAILCFIGTTRGSAACFRGGGAPTYMSQLLQLLHLESVSSGESSARPGAAVWACTRLNMNVSSCERDPVGRNGWNDSAT